MSTPSNPQTLFQPKIRAAQAYITFLALPVGTVIFYMPNLFWTTFYLKLTEFNFLSLTFFPFLTLPPSCEWLTVEEITMNFSGAWMGQ